MTTPTKTTHLEAILAVLSDQDVRMLASQDMVDVTALYLAEALKGHPSGRPYLTGDETAQAVDKAWWKGYTASIQNRQRSTPTSSTEAFEAAVEGYRNALLVIRDFLPSEESRVTRGEALAVAEAYTQQAVMLRPGEFPEFNIEALNVIREYVWQKFEDPEDQHILHVFTNIDREFAKGHRCGVCGRTKAQNEALGYDCAREC